MADSWRNDPLSEVMTGNVVRIASGATLYDAQRVMTDAKLARLVVTDKAGKLRAMITRRDLARFLSRDKTGRPLDSIPVGECMSAPTITLRPTDTIADAARLMDKKGISSIVVTDDGNEILGVVTKTDLCFHFSLFTSEEKVRDFMSHRVFTVKPTHSIFFVASILARQGISRVPVVDEKLRGIVTLSDITESAPVMRPDIAPGRSDVQFYRGLLAPSAKLTAMTAADLMTPNPITISSEEPLSRAAELMIEHGISGLPVVDAKGRLHGMVTKTDIIRAITH